MLRADMLIRAAARTSYLGSWALLNHRKLQKHANHGLVLKQGKTIAMQAYANFAAIPTWCQFEDGSNTSGAPKTQTSRFIHAIMCAGLLEP